jgi:hypothetical protein
MMANSILQDLIMMENIQKCQEDIHLTMEWVHLIHQILLMMECHLSIHQDHHMMAHSTLQDHPMKE